MKNWKETLYWVTFILYEEILFSLIIFEANVLDLLWIILLSLPLGLFFSIISSTFKRLVNIIISYISVFLICFLMGAHLIYYRIYESILSFYSIINGGQVTGFMSTILEKMGQNTISLVCIFIPFVILIVLHLTKVLKFERDTVKTILLKIETILILHMCGTIGINTIKTEGIYSRKNVYYNIHVPKITAKKMGIYTAMKLDIKRLAFGFEENLIMTPIPQQEVMIEQGKEYNITEIDFDKLISEETDESIILMHDYFKSKTPSECNEYTGMFEGKNLVVFVAEGLSDVAIREDVTPNLYRLYKEGFQFDNFYTPLFPVSTADGEYITDTSLIPKEGVWSIHKVVGNYMPYSYANVFESLGYSSNSYHNHTASYYNRDEYLYSMGYDSYLAVGTGLEERMNTKLWPNSDYEMINVTVDDYINNDKFMAYYMTVSGHLNYTTNGNCMAQRNWEDVKDLSYSHKAKAYLACQKELDKAVGELLNRLEEAGKLEDTVIVLSPDHYPYGLTLAELNELSNYQRDNAFEKHHTPLLIWSGSMKEPVKVEKICSSLDVLPTVLNLFGVDYDSRLLMGEDILADNKERIVIFSDRSFISEKGRYNAVSGQFIPNEGVEIEDDYIERISELIYYKFKMSAMILDKDYYRKVF